MVNARVFNSAAEYSESMSNFLDLVNIAHVIFNGSEIEVNGHATDNSEIRINSFLNDSTYKERLSNAYSKALDEIKATLKIYDNYDSLYFIVALIAEIVSTKELLQKNTQDQYHHKLFDFSNISQAIKFHDHILDESIFQISYFWMDHYLVKMNIFLSTLKESLTKIQFEDSNSYKPLHVVINASTIENPLAFFNYLFLHGGLATMKKDFIPTFDQIEYSEIRYNPETETIIDDYLDQETGEWVESSRSFHDFYLNMLYNEFLLSSKHIDDRIITISDKPSAVHFLKILLSSLGYLLDAIERNPDAKKYESSSRPVTALIRFIRYKYGFSIPKGFLPELTGKKTIKNATVSIPKPRALTSTKPGLKSFSWIFPDPSPFSNLLWIELKSGSKFIPEDTAEEVFNNAFNGSDLLDPLGIKWTVPYGKYTNKHALFYLLDKLVDAKLINDDTNNSTLFCRIKLIFFDKEGKNLKHLKVSSFTSNISNIRQDLNSPKIYKKRKIDYKKPIDDIITKLKELSKKDLNPPD